MPLMRLAWARLRRPHAGELFAGFGAQVCDHRRNRNRGNPLARPAAAAGRCRSPGGPRSQRTSRRMSLARATSRRNARPAREAARRHPPTVLGPAQQFRQRDVAACVLQSSSSQRQRNLALPCARTAASARRRPGRSAGRAASVGGRRCRAAAAADTRRGW